MKTTAQLASRERCPIIVPGWNAKGHLTYNIYLVEVMELASFLPAGTVLKTNDYNAAKAYVQGYRDYNTSQGDLAL